MEKQCRAVLFMICFTYSGGGDIFENFYSSGNGIFESFYSSGDGIFESFYSSGDGVSETFCMEYSDNTSAGILTFPRTKVNSVAISDVFCISPDHIPRATRTCKGDLITAARWTDLVVVNCIENAMISLPENRHDFVQEFFETVEEKGVTSSNVTYIARDLADITSPDVFMKEDIDNVAIVLEKIINVKSQSQTVTLNVLEIIDNIITSQSIDDEDIMTSERSASFLRSLELQLDTIKRSGYNFTDNRANINVKVVQIQNFEQAISFVNLLKEDSENLKTILNPDHTLLDQQRFQLYFKFPNIIPQLPGDCFLSNNSSKTSFPVAFTVHRSGDLFNDPQLSQRNRKRDSWIISASTLCGMISHLPSESYVITQFSPLSKTKLMTSGFGTAKRSLTMERKAETDGTCVFWDVDYYGKGSGEWSSEGCYNSRTKDSKLYECRCTHLPKFASFSVLIDVQGIINNVWLSILTVIGCLTSIVSLLVTIVSFLSIKKLLTSQPKQTLLNLCISLLGLYSCFLIGIKWTDPRNVCIIFAGLIHFFCLSSVTWMSIEATQMYILFVKVFNAHVEYFLVKASLIAWGIPLVVVAVSVGIGNDSYSHEYCFPKHDSPWFIFGQFGIIGVLLAYNSIVYTIIIWNISVTRRAVSGSQTNRNRVIRRLQNAFAISFLVGISWLFGFLAIEIWELRLIFSILFCVFNSFQGLFIFLLFCMREEEVRAVWGNWLTICNPRSKGNGDVIVVEETASRRKNVVNCDKIMVEVISQRFGDEHQMKVLNTSTIEEVLSDSVSK